MAALLVLLLLLAVPPTAFTTTDVYYVTAHDAAGHEQSCLPYFTNYMYCILNSCEIIDSGQWKNKTLLHCSFLHS